MGEYNRAIEDYTRVISLHEQGDTYLARGQAPEFKPASPGY